METTGDHYGEREKKLIYVLNGERKRKGRMRRKEEMEEGWSNKYERVMGFVGWAHHKAPHFMS